jgi:tRNA (mo5U34)-methyltransferase
MIDYQHFLSLLPNTPLAPWLETLPEKLARACSPNKHGRLPEWEQILASLPCMKAKFIDLNDAQIRLGKPDELTFPEIQTLEQSLRALHPWRKGPFNLFGIEIDTEWHSDWKWARLAQAIEPLQSRRILDVGCGSGYHGLRMLGDGAKQVIGIEPIMLYVVQFHAIRHFAPELPMDVLPLLLEDLPEDTKAFDTVFSMGVLYHQRSPIDHLLQLHGNLRPGGELVLETLILEGNDGRVLTPADRYAKMRNVWFIPDVATLQTWLKRSRFIEAKVVDITPTTIEEQRSTDWMQFESLVNFLDPNDPTRTIEGYPAPVRAILTAKAG